MDAFVHLFFIPCLLLALLPYGQADYCIDDTDSTVLYTYTGPKTWEVWSASTPHDDLDYDIMHGGSM